MATKKGLKVLLLGGSPVCASSDEEKLRQRAINSLEKFAREHEGAELFYDTLTVMFDDRFRTHIIRYRITDLETI